MLNFTGYYITSRYLAQPWALLFQLLLLILLWRTLNNELCQLFIYHYVSIKSMPRYTNVVALVPGLPQYTCTLIVRGKETFEIGKGLG